VRPLAVLTVANIKSFVRDRAGIFWTLAFPILFVVLFGSIFSGDGPDAFAVGWVDEDGTPASTGLRQGFEGTGLFTLTDGELDPSLERMRDGDLDAVVVVPDGVGEAIEASTGGAAGGGTATGDPVSLRVYTDPSQQTQSSTIQHVVAQVVSATNQAISGRPPVLMVEAASLQTEDITPAAYFVPSILAMALMQLGVFSAIPLVEQREKLILKRLGATPLRRWTLVGSNILMRLLIALLQSVLIVGIGAIAFGVTIVGSLAVVAGFVVLGSVTFISLGYVIASFARTEESANALTSIVQFPLMFLSGIFFPIDFMPEFLRPIAAFMPLTYLGDALRQVMVGGAPFATLPIDAGILAAWLVVSFLISARFFRWQ
jgi:ABC-2 type transport system permease protein